MKTEITETKWGYDLHVDGYYISTWRLRREAERCSSAWIALDAEHSQRRTKISA